MLELYTSPGDLPSHATLVLEPATLVFFFFRDSCIITRVFFKLFPT